MSRGPGRWQLTILRGLRESSLFPLRGATAAETAALVRAARKLEEAGQCVVVRRSGEGGGAVIYAAAPGKTAPRS
jgi:hypothetical protein